MARVDTILNVIEKVYGHDESKIDQNEFLELLCYDPDTGEFIWRFSLSYGRKKGARADRVASDGNRYVRINRRQYSAHRVAWFIVHGEWPDLIRHKNGNKGDNWINNLRNLTRRQLRLESDLAKGKTGRTGVFPVKSGDRTMYMARIKHNGKSYYLGAYDTPELASGVYKAKKREFDEETSTEKPLL